MVYNALQLVFFFFFLGAAYFLFPKAPQAHYIDLLVLRDGAEMWKKHRL